MRIPIYVFISCLVGERAGLYFKCHMTSSSKTIKLAAVCRVTSLGLHTRCAPPPCSRVSRVQAGSFSSFHRYVSKGRIISSLIPTRLRILGGTPDGPRAVSLLTPDVIPFAWTRFLYVLHRFSFVFVLFQVLLHCTARCVGHAPGSRFHTPTYRTSGF